MPANERMNPARSRIAIVEDEPDIASLVVSYLRKEGFLTETFSTGRAFLLALEKRAPDLLLLDLMLPDMNGVEVCRALKIRPEWRSIPVIMLTAKGEESDKIVGLEMGADDYMTKPFSLRELAARVRTVLRRTLGAAPATTIEVGDKIVLDAERHEIRLDGHPLEVTSTEFKILHLLALKKGRVFSRDQILDQIWGHEKIVLDRTVDVHIKNLREKLGPAGDVIKNVRGVGYKVEE
jgi:DNA-binding response OmpR family regulator